MLPPNEWLRVLSAMSRASEPARFSIVTPCFNDADYIRDCIESIRAQSHEDWEHIVVDGGSKDGTVEILKSYPHLRWVSEPDRGQAHALNKAFAMAEGTSFGWLNADDTFLPNALEIAARELDRERRRHIVMGRCAYVDEAGRFTGLYHPRGFRSRRRLLQIWRGYTIPQPAVFFHREVLEACGGLDESLHFGLDYDLFLRFSEKYDFHLLEDTLATYRLHSESKTSALSEEELLEVAVRISRRYWGPPDSSLHRRLALSYWVYRHSPWRLATRFWKRAGASFREGRRWKGTFWLVAALAVFPPVPLYRYRYNVSKLWDRLSSQSARRLDPQA